MYHAAIIAARIVVVAAATYVIASFASGVHAAYEEDKANKE